MSNRLLIQSFCVQGAAGAKELTIQLPMHLGSARGLRPQHGRWTRVNLQDFRNCRSAYSGGHPQRHEQHGNRTSQQCSRNIYFVRTTNHNPRSWDWCRSRGAHNPESSVLGPMVDIFHWGLMAQAYNWPDLGLVSSPVTSLAVVKAQ